MDMISSLPDDVISHILSFLPIKEAALTSVLAKRWRILFAFSSNLNFFDYVVGRLQSFTEFVDRVLSVSGHSTIKKFTLRSDRFYQAYLYRWISDLPNRGVMELGIQGVLDFPLGGYPRAEISLPFETFTCKTLVKLNLSGFFIDVLSENSFLPALKTLVLKFVKLCSPHVCGFQKLLSACPVLEDLTVENLLWEEGKWPRLISSLSLQRLTIWLTLFVRFKGSDCGGITFETPNLTYLAYSDHVLDFYHIVNLNSLVEAKLDLFVKQVDSGTIGNPTNLIKGLRNVKIMKLTSQCMEMFYFFYEAIPVFKNLFQLSVGPITERCWRALPFLLNKSPNLETLIITVLGPLTNSEIGYGSSGYSCLLSCPVKVLKIIVYQDTSQDMKNLKHFLANLKHFLANLSCLELLEVKSWGTEEDKSRIANDLLMLPRASSKCKINVI